MNAKPFLLKTELPITHVEYSEAAMQNVIIFPAINYSENN